MSFKSPKSYGEILDFSKPMPLSPMEDAKNFQHTFFLPLWTTANLSFFPSDHAGWLAGMADLYTCMQDQHKTGTPFGSGCPCHQAMLEEITVTFKQRVKK